MVPSSCALIHKTDHPSQKTLFICNIPVIAAVYYVECQKLKEQLFMETRDESRACHLNPVVQRRSTPQSKGSSHSSRTFSVLNEAIDVILRVPAVSGDVHLTPKPSE